MCVCVCVCVCLCVCVGGGIVCVSVCGGVSVYDTDLILIVYHAVYSYLQLCFFLTAHHCVLLFILVHGILIMLFSLFTLVFFVYLCVMLFIHVYSRECVNRRRDNVDGERGRGNSVTSAPE